MKKICVFFCGLLLVSAVKDDTHKGFNLKGFEKSLAYIPMGSFFFTDSIGGPDSKGAHKIVSLQPFYMCNHEVTNEEYREFLTDLKSKDMDQYNKMRPDTTVWQFKNASNEGYVKYYFQHPAYQDYPVVGITHVQAEAYCSWLTEKYMADENRKYKNVKFELPTVYQWDYAAAGGLAYSPFPWGGPCMTNAKGQSCANYMKIGQGMVKKEQVYIKDSAGNFKESTAIVVDWNSTAGQEVYSNESPNELTVPVTSYQANGYGLYNMAGNVKEYVKEEGITKGGGWNDYGYYLQNWVEQPYSTTEKATDDRGFRFIMEVLK